MTMRERKIVAVATAMLAYDSQAGPHTWRDLAAVAVAAAEAFEQVDGDAWPPVEIRGTVQRPR